MPLSLCHMPHATMPTCAAWAPGAALQAALRAPVELWRAVGAGTRGARRTGVGSAAGTPAGGGAHAGGLLHGHALLLAQEVVEKRHEHAPGQRARQALQHDRQVGARARQRGRLAQRDALAVLEARARIRALRACAALSEGFARARARCSPGASWHRLGRSVGCPVTFVARHSTHSSAASALRAIA